MGSHLAKPVPVDNTKIKVGNPLANRVPVVLTALLVHQVVLVQNTRKSQVAGVATVATVVMVGLKLPRPPRAEWGRRWWVGVIRRRVLSQSRTGLPGVILLLLGRSCTSTLKTQTSTAAMQLLTCMAIF